MRDADVWYDVKDFEGLYKITTSGKFKSLDRAFINSIGVTRKLRGKLILDCVFNGYKYIRLHKDTIRTSHGVHKWLSLQFLLIPIRYKDISIYDLEINHKDGNKLNNKLNNLEWCTSSENQKHAISTGLQMSSSSDWRSKAVIQYDLDDNYIATYGSIGEAERATGVHSGGISDVCNNKRSKTAGGFKWKFK